jgi:alpha-acetolactate decarboxylase
MKTRHIKSLRRLLLGGTITAAATLALATALPFNFTHHGHFQRMMRTGDTGGKVALADLPRQPGTWGVGATAGLKGEIIQIDGKVLVSEGTDDKGRVQAPMPGEQAVLFASAQVRQWVDVRVPADMDQAQFEAFVSQQAQQRGLSLEQPFVFRVDGRFPRMRWHVVTGEAPSGAHGGHGSHMGGGHGGHANKQSGMKEFHQPGASGQLVGLYSGAALEGAVSHPGERFHVHYADAPVAVSGHVDAYSVAEGSVLKLPVQ